MRSNNDNKDPFSFEGFMYGFIPSAVNIPANAVQGTAGLILGIALVKIFERLKIKKAGSNFCICACPYLTSSLLLITFQKNSSLGEISEK